MGGGTQLDLGMPPARVGPVVETTGLNRIVEYEPADLTVTVEAGMRFAELQRILGEQGQFLALDPPLEDEATIGGAIATNASGPLRFAFGTARDLVIGTRVANPDGSVTHAGGRVVKNVAGYDLNKLYIGSLGTLARDRRAELQARPDSARDGDRRRRLRGSRLPRACGAIGAVGALAAVSHWHRAAWARGGWCFASADIRRRSSGRCATSRRSSSSMAGKRATRIGTSCCRRACRGAAP